MRPTVIRTSRHAVAMGLLLATPVTLGLVAERDAAACGGCFHPPVPPTQTANDITDERMLLSVSKTQSTLYDQIRYAGSPSSFAWVLPIHGTVDVGLSADVLFDSIDALTATEIVAPEAFCNCPVGGSASSGSSSSGGSLGAAAPPAVTVTKAENVGPYATVQLHSTDASALDNWLAQNGFDIPADVVPVINQYVVEGFDFLAMKLLPNQGVQAMRPVRVTTPGGSLSLPLRMAAVGTGVKVGITIWVVSDGRYEPQNYPFFHIEDSELVWDFATSLSNYTTLRAANETALGGGGWEVESSITLNQQLITSVILDGGRYFAGNGGFGPSSSSGSAAGGPAPASDDYLSVGDPAARSDAGPYQSAEEVRAADIAALFAGISGSNARVTRIRSDIAHAAMTKDLVLRASADQSELSNVRLVTQGVNLNCPAGCSQGTASNPSGAPSPPSAPNPPAASSSGAPGSGYSGGGSSASSGGAGSLGGGGRGCAASSLSSGGPAPSFGGAVCALGIALVRMVRTRRRSAGRKAVSGPA